MRMLEVRLGVGAAVAETMRRFYLDELGLAGDGAALRVGHTRLEFMPVDETDPFYHFALRVPRNRFAAARDWIATRTRVLDETRFDNWNADACYVEDPAGNIVELIAHGDLPEEGTEGPFSANELLGVCELGLVGPDLAAMATALHDIGIELWDGSLESGRLAFMGGREGVLILCPAGRGWMPTGRPAEPHSVEATVAGQRAGEVLLPGTQHRIRTVPSG